MEFGGFTFARVGQDFIRFGQLFPAMPEVEIPEAVSSDQKLKNFTWPFVAQGLQNIDRIGGAQPQAPLEIGKFHSAFAFDQKFDHPASVFEGGDPASGLVRGDECGNEKHPVGTPGGERCARHGEMGEVWRIETAAVKSCSCHRQTGLRGSRGGFPHPEAFPAAALLRGLR